ncbi:MAG: DUF1848 domain-containing protein [Bacteroidales bacterium]|nr:DUF1848 domain-containing protein [Bacteroidales bacterium]
MILNTGGRTDTVQYYSQWLLNRFREGYVLSRNPMFPNNVSRIELAPATIDVVVFCSKDYSPILPHLNEISSRFRCFYHYTITAYGSDIEPRVPSIEASIDTCLRLSAMVGRERIAWRYDPVLLTEKYTIERHLDTFDRMATLLAPHVGRCIFSFVEVYKKLEFNMPELRPINAQQRQALAEGLGRIARQHCLKLQTCGTAESYDTYGIEHSGCMTTQLFHDALGIDFKRMTNQGNRAGCRCMESRGLGDYNSCPNGCRYCYANRDHLQAMRNYALHDPTSPLLLGHLRSTDIVRPLRQVSITTTEPTLF